MKAQVLLFAAILFLGLNSFKSEKKDNAETAPATVVAANLNTCISGIIIDETTGEALLGVEVELEGSQLKTYTDFDGKFSFDGVVPGEYKVSTAYISYQKSESRSFKVNQNEMHTLNLNLKTANK